MSDELGPLEQFLGYWEGNVGVDVSYHNKEDETAETGYFEKARFTPIPIVENGQQTMHGLNYEMTAWRHGEEQLDPFHDEVGYLLWEPSTSTVLRCFAVPRGLAILAGGTARPDSKSLTFIAEPGDPTFGLVQNKYLAQRARTGGKFVSEYTVHDDGTFSYTSDLQLTLAAIDQTMHHTDRNTLHRTGSDVTWPHRL
ncbi:MAG: FABP family protein [Actinobacteria bacterium 69-20]|nr:FABP family protein [Actinomycetota bacterium]OJV26850.1 MAG: FABP family protein [Actinobacteria bacterium 69-20]